MADTTTYTPKNAFESLKERLHVLDETAISFTKSRATQAAASLAYYTFFSIFPLMLLFILGGSYFLDQQSTVQRVTQAVRSVLPISQQWITQNLQQVLNQRVAVGILVLVSLLWSASSMFSNLAHDINNAWPEANDRNFIQSRLVGVGMIFGLIGLLILSIVLDSLTKWLSGPNPANGNLGNLNPLALLSGLGSWIAIFLLYLAMYRWVPTVDVAWSASIWGALAAAVGWKAASTGFSWYLSSPFAEYQLVYGSLGAIVAFLFLIYITAMVTLFGAHLTAALDNLHQKREARAVAAAPSGAQPVPVTGPHSEAEKAREKSKQEAEEEAEFEPPPYPREDDNDNNPEKPSEDTGG